MAEILTHAAFYAGWPNAWSALTMAKEIYTADEKPAKDYSYTKEDLQYFLDNMKPGTVIKLKTRMCKVMNRVSKETAKLCMEDGYRISDEQRRRFLEVAAWFGCTEEDALGYISGSSGFRKSWDAGESTSGAGVMSYGEALRILGVSSLATDRDIKRAYHRLAHRCHPDMARNRGFSDDVVKVYAQKFEKVNDAWNAVRRERGI